ncbi:hypothetical protein [Streptomyces sp. NPDC004528]|uniref:hypothetical protein n=1 Tax=Streptomyces sp. NPDC004528 TaxID=3154550 RepID=UPI0033A80D4F
MSRTEVTDELIHAAQGGDADAMWSIVETMDPMLKSIIRSAVPRASSDDVDDLMQEARAVVIQRVRDYNSGADSASFTGFVFREVRRTVQEVHVGMSTALSVDPGAALRVKRAIWNAGGNVEEAWLALSSVSESRDQMSRERFMSTLEALALTDSLDAPAGGEDGDGSGLTLSDVIADPTATMTDSVERRDYARWLMTQIPPRQAFTLRAYYGVSMTAQPDAQTADEMGIRPAAVRRLRTNGCESARKVANVHAWLREQAPTSQLAEAA